MAPACRPFLPPPLVVSPRESEHYPRKNTCLNAERAVPSPPDQGCVTLFPPSCTMTAECRKRVQKSFLRLSARF
jgi:hypothetical protein